MNLIKQKAKRTAQINDFYNEQKNKGKNRVIIFLCFF